MDPVVQQVASTVLPTRWGTFQMFGFHVTRVLSTGRRTDDILVLQIGNPQSADAVVRIHSQCLTGDAFGSLRCDCGPQLDAALKRIAKQRNGLLLYEPEEGRGIGLMAKLQAYALQDAGADTIEANLRLGFPADSRDYASSCAVLRCMDIRAVRLMTNNPEKVRAVERAGISVIERIHAGVEVPSHAAAYIATKLTRMAHYAEAADA